jgi:hypothetical protein
MPPCPILSTTATCLVYIIGGVFILDIFGVNTTSIIALPGAAGLAVDWPSNRTWPSSDFHMLTEQGDANLR